MQFGYATRRLGLRLSGRWDTPTQVKDTAALTGSSGHSLIFHHGVTLDVRFYLNLKEVREAVGLPWLDGRLYLAVDNLLGSGTRIRDENGRNVDYYRSSGEDLGRSIRLSFRKFFP